MNFYKDKYFSIVGDSISTLTTYNPDGYRVFYIEETCEETGVYKMEDTWWGQVIEHFEGKLLVNNSYSGSRVTKLPYWCSLFPSGCSKERTSKLHCSGKNPDVIIIYLGFNDWANFVDVDGSQQKSLLKIKKNMSVFSEAYAQMVRQMQLCYPKAELWCCTLNATYISSQPSFVFSDWEAHQGKIEAYNDVIRKVAEESGSRLIDLYGHHEWYDSIDGAHPNAEGMKTIAKLVVKEVESWN